MATQRKISQYQERVYIALQQIPSGRVTTYAAISKALDSSPRAVGGALRVNPFCPEVPCHRCIASTGVRTPPFDIRLEAKTDHVLEQFVGGYKGDWGKAPSGQNQESKLQLLKDEGVDFSADGFLIDKSLLWNDFDIAKLN